MGSLRLDVEPTSVQQEIWATRSGPVCIETNNLPASLRRVPLAKATDALFGVVRNSSTVSNCFEIQDWSLLKGFANPPWVLVGQVLAQVQAQI